MLLPRRLIRIALASHQLPPPDHHDLIACRSSYLLNSCSSQPRSPPLNVPLPPKLPMSGNRGAGGPDSLTRLLSLVSGRWSSSTASSVSPFSMIMLLLRLNQLPLFFCRSSGRVEAEVEAIEGEEGRLRLCGGCCSSDVRGRLSEVRELLKEERRLERLRSLRTPEGRRWMASGDDVVGVADAGETGVWKLLFLGFGTAVSKGDVDVMIVSSCSGAGVGGKAPGM